MVSVLVPIYNVAPYIERCARSLFEQTFSDIEFVFVDDCSPDDSISILQEVVKDYPAVGERVRIIRNNENKGLAAVRNIAVEKAKGEFILHVDSDDWLEKDTVELLYSTAIAEDADVVACDFNEIRKKGSSIIVNNCIPDPLMYAKSLLRRKSLTHIIGKLIRKSILTDNGLRAVEGLNQGEDYLMTPKIAYFSRRIAKVDKPLYYYNRLNVNSYTANVSDHAIDCIIKVQNLLVDFFRNIPDAEIFKDTLDESCIYNKITCFYCAPFSSYKKIRSLYMDIDWHRMRLKSGQRLILRLSDAGMTRSVYALIRFANFIMK